MVRSVRTVHSSGRAGRPSTRFERHRRRSATLVTISRLLRRFGGILLALTFLIVCMLLCLWMRTQMVQDSFTVSHLASSVAMLRQDVEDRQTRLDYLNAQLPQKASKLGLVVSDSSVQVDLSQPAPLANSKDAK